jgi:DNA-binding transcriptional regulator PaaX
MSCRSTKRYNEKLRELSGFRAGNNTYYATMSRLHRKGLVEKTKTGWRITDDGIKKEKRLSSLYITSPFDKESKGNTIIAFDIPEGNRRSRVWLRNQLKIFGYTMLQRSLWFGPGPLPKEFYSRLVMLDIKKCIKIFKIKLN